MQPFCSLFQQILKVVPRGGFEALARNHRSERHARGFTSWQQLVAMLFCHIGRAQSLREIEHGLRAAKDLELRSCGRRACSGAEKSRWKWPSAGKSEFDRLTLLHSGKDNICYAYFDAHDQRPN